MNKFMRITILALVSMMAFSLVACGSRGSGMVSSESVQPAGTVAVALDFVERKTYSSNQFAIWIEDLEGNFVKTVYVTRFTADGGYKKREDSVPVWVSKSHIDSASKKEIDAISGATPKSGSLMYIWDLTDQNGQKVAAGEYKFFVETTVYKESQSVHTGVIDISGEAMTAVAEADYTTDLAKDEAIIADVKAIWKK